MGPATDNVWFGDIAGDNVYVTRYQPSGTMRDIDQLVVAAQDGSLSSYWSGNYTTIERVNMLLDRLEGSAVEDNDKRVFEAEAKFSGPILTSTLYVFLEEFRYMTSLLILGLFIVHQDPQRMRC